MESRLEELELGQIHVQTFKLFVQVLMTIEPCQADHDTK